MARGNRKLTARAAATLKPGRHGDGDGLYLIVSPSGARKWVYRFTFDGRVTETGLGSAAVVTLAEARDKAQAARKLRDTGEDPIAAKRRVAMKTAGVPTFGAMADVFIASKEAEWRNEKHRAQWRMTLAHYAAPLRSRPVSEIGTEAVLAILTPIWQAKPETASRLRGRIEAVLDAAKARGYRSGENPARWRGHLSHLLFNHGRLIRGHHAAMPYADVAVFVGRLRERKAIASLALEFCILTAARSGEVLGACWSEIDFAAKVWTIPACRMKAGREHRIPLSDRALAIIEKLSETRTGDFVFAGQRRGKPLSSMAMEMILRRMGAHGVTVHGFRSTFRDWVGNETHFPREIAEAALSHVIGDKAEAAYRRGDALEKRRTMMEAWAGYCAQRTGATVLPFATATDAA